MDCSLRTASRTFQPRQQQKRAFGKPNGVRRVIYKVYNTTYDKRCDDTCNVQDWFNRTGFIHDGKFNVQGSGFEVQETLNPEF